MKNTKKLLFLVLFVLFLIQSVYALDNNLHVSAKYSKKEICSCNTTRVTFDIGNIGKFQEIYTLSTDREFKSWASFSHNNIVLNPGEKTTVYAYITPDCKFYGKETINLFVKTVNSKLKATLPIELNVKQCIKPEIELKAIDIEKGFLYFLPLLLIILIVLIIALIVKKKAKKKKKVKIKPVEPVEEHIELKPRKLTKRQRKRIIKLLIGILVVWLIAINLFAFKHKLTFEIQKNVTIPEVIPESPKVDTTYYDTIINIGSSILDFIKTYYLYLIVGFICLTLIIVLIILIRKKLMKLKRIMKVKEKKIVEKEIKKPKIKTKTIIRIIIGVVIVALIAVILITTWNFIKLYYLYFIIAFVLLAIVIFFLILLRKKKIKPKVKKAVEKKVVEKKVIEKPKIEKKKPRKKRKKIPKKTLKRLLKVSVVLVILLLFALYVTLNYEEIGIQKPEKNFLENFFDKTKQLMGQSLNINITKLIQPEEIPGVVFERGIPPQKWAINTIHNLDLSKYFSDPDGDILTYSSTKPKDIAVEINENIVTLSPEYNWVGVNNITFTASDSKGGIVKSNTVYLVVQEEKTDIASKFNEYKTKVITFFISVKDYITFYLNYIITGVVILLILILIITYNKRLLKFLEEEKPKIKKRKK